VEELGTMSKNNLRGISLGVRSAADPDFELRGGPGLVLVAPPAFLPFFHPK